MDEIKHMLNLASNVIMKQDDEDMEYNRELRLWYFDKWLPCVCSKDAYDDDARLEHYPTSNYTFRDREKMRVTNNQEAFGLFMLENCETKWHHTFKLKKDRGSQAKVPTKFKDGQNAEYKGKFSEAGSGAKAYGGWNDNTVPTLNTYIKWSQNWRTNEQLNGYDTYDNVKELIKAARGTEEPKSSGRKRKKKQETPKVVRRMKTLDD